LEHVEAGEAKTKGCRNRANGEKGKWNEEKGEHHVTGAITPKLLKHMTTPLIYTAKCKNLIFLSLPASVHIPI
jgi:hypothetical protein